MALRYVIDASAGVEILLRSTLGEALQLRLVPEAQWWIPEHYYTEVVNALRRTERHGILAGRVPAAIDELHRASLARATLRPLLAAAWVRRGHLTIGDAFYVALAEAIDATLVTADLKLAAAPGLPVPVLTP